MWNISTSAGKSSKPNVKRFSSAAVRALLKTTVSGLTWMPLGSMPVPSGLIKVTRCFIVLLICAKQNAVASEIYPRVEHVPSLEFESLSASGGACLGRTYRFDGMHEFNTI
jgi:hypothetical protein